MSDHARTELTTTVDVSDGHACVTAVGEIDLYTAPRFAEALDSAAAGRRPIRVDLTGVEFMDSTGLRCLLQARARAEAEGGAIALELADGSAVQRLLTLAGVLPMFGLAENGS
jgi:anti-sigma B factor antagonist